MTDYVSSVLIFTELVNDGTYSEWFDKLCNGMKESADSNGDTIYAFTATVGDGFTTIPFNPMNLEPFRDWLRTNAPVVISLEVTGHVGYESLTFTEPIVSRP